MLQINLIVKIYVLFLMVIIRDFIKKNISSLQKKGILKPEDGRVLGTHNGIHDFTIGQRKGIGVGGYKR